MIGSSEKAKRIQIMARYLYDRMPGAAPVPEDENGKLWGEVGNSDHYAFCYAVATLVAEADTRVHLDAD